MAAEAGADSGRRPTSVDSRVVKRRPASAFRSGCMRRESLGFEKGYAPELKLASTALSQASLCKALDHNVLLRAPRRAGARNRQAAGRALYRGWPQERRRSRLRARARNPFRSRARASRRHASRSEGQLPVSPASRRGSQIGSSSAICTASAATPTLTQCWQR